MKEPLQQITSKNTCIKTFPRIFKSSKEIIPELFVNNNINLDYGGGKYDDISNYLSLRGVTNLVFDPFNRDNSHNSNIQYHLTCVSGADSCTMSNVLNVIKEPMFRHRALVNAKHMMKHGSKIYISIYDGNRSNIGCETSKGWQENRATKTYLAEVSEVFSNVHIKNNIIVGEKS